MRRRILLGVVLTAALLALNPSAAQASAFFLSLTDGITTINITDNGAGDFRPTVDDQILGSNITIGTFSVQLMGAMFYGVTAPVQMNFTNIRVTSTAAGTLTATLLRQDLSPGTLGLGTAVVGIGTGGATTGGAGNVAFASYIDPSNGTFGTQVFNTTIPGGLQGTPTPVILGSGNFSMLTELDFNFTSAGIISGTSGLQVLNAAPVPEPTTLLLLGPGMVGLAALRRRRRSKKL